MNLIGGSGLMDHNHRLLELSELCSGESLMLFMQDAVLTPGMHILNVSTFKHGREVFAEILNSLPIFPTVGCLSNVLSPESIDIVGEILANIDGEESRISIELLEEYLLYSLSADVILVELDPLLIAKPWFGDLYYLLGQLHGTSSIVIFNALEH